MGRGRSAYLPELVVGPHQPHFLNATRKLPPRQQYAIAELLGGNLITHSFYATRSPDTKAPYGDSDYVPFFFHEPITGPELSALIRHHGSAPFLLNHAHSGISAEVDPGKFGEHILKHVDGKKTFKEIFSLVRLEKMPPGGGPGDDELFRDFRLFFDFLTAIDRLLLRHRSVPPSGDK